MSSQGGAIREGHLPGYDFERIQFYWKVFRVGQACFVSGGEEAILFNSTESSLLEQKEEYTEKCRS